jgi:uncharacterized protein YcfL
MTKYLALVIVGFLVTGCASNQPDTAPTPAPKSTAERDLGKV